MKPFKSLAVALIASGMLATSPAQAQSRDFATVYAECGIGAMIFSADTENNKLLAIISNVTWDLGTTAHSSNLSSPDSCAKSEAVTAAFIMQTYPAIERDLAMGDGEYLRAMLNYRGCDSSIQPALIDDLRGDMASVVSVPGYADNDRQMHASALYDTLQDRVESNYSTSCLI